MSEQYNTAVNTSGDLTHSPDSNSSKKKSAGAFRTISEVAGILGVQQHVLRFWETKFTQVKPLKRGGGRRYYRPEDIEILQHIHHLLYTEGYTIKGVQKLLRGHGKSQVANGEFKKEQSIQANRDVNRGLAANQYDKQEPVTEPAPAHQSTESEQEKEDLSDRQKAILSSMIGELKDLRDMVRAADTSYEDSQDDTE